jgi:hypothetical protein
MSFGIYVVGFLILIGGLIYGAVLLHIARSGLPWVQSYFWAWRFRRASKRRGGKIHRYKPA